MAKPIPLTLATCIKVYFSPPTSHPPDSREKMCTFCKALIRNGSIFAKSAHLFLKVHIYSFEKTPQKVDANLL